MKRDIKVGVSPLLIITRILIVLGVLTVYFCFALSFVDFNSNETEKGNHIVEQTMSLDVEEM